MKTNTDSKKTKNIKIKAVIFDCDGVLVDSEPISCNAWRPVFKRMFGVDIGTDFKAVIGMNFKDAINYFLDQHSLKGDIYEIVKAKEEEYFNSGKGNLKSFTGTVDFIEKILSLNLKTAVASSGTHEKIGFNLKESGLLKYFDTVISCEDVKRGKPEPDLFLAAAEKLDTPPENCIVIEDSLLGVRGAKKGGMYCIGIANSFPKEKLKEADMVVENLMEIPIEDLI